MSEVDLVDRVRGLQRVQEVVDGHPMDHRETVDENSMVLLIFLNALIISTKN